MLYMEHEELKRRKRGDYCVTTSPQPQPQTRGDERRRNKEEEEWIQEHLCRQ